MVHADAKRLHEGCQVVTGTPARLCQLVKDQRLKLDAVRLFVMDEADKLMEDSYQETVNWLFSQLPQSKQVAVFSATYPAELDTFLSQYMQSPTMVRVSNDVQLKGIKQYLATAKAGVDTEESGDVVKEKAMEIKMDLLERLLKRITYNQCLIFCNYQDRALEVCGELRRRGCGEAEFISGQLDQDQRTDVIQKLKRFKCRILVSTDLTARGIDAQNVNLVVNLEVPNDHSTYFHRIGRAGRYGAYGAAVTIVVPAADENRFFAIGSHGEFRVKELPDLETGTIPSDLCSNENFWDSQQTVILPEKKIENGVARSSKFGAKFAKNKGTLFLNYATRKPTTDKNRLEPGEYCLKFASEQKDSGWFNGSGVRQRYTREEILQINPNGVKADKHVKFAESISSGKDKEIEKVTGTSNDSAILPHFKKSFKENEEKQSLSVSESKNEHVVTMPAEPPSFGSLCTPVRQLFLCVAQGEKSQSSNPDPETISESFISERQVPCDAMFNDETRILQEPANAEQKLKSNYTESEQKQKTVEEKDQDVKNGTHENGICGNATALGQMADILFSPFDPKKPSENLKLDTLLGDFGSEKPLVKKAEIAVKDRPLDSVPEGQTVIGSKVASDKELRYDREALNNFLSAIPSYHLRNYASSKWDLDDFPFVKDPALRSTYYHQLALQRARGKAGQVLNTDDVVNTGKETGEGGFVNKWQTRSKWSSVDVVQPDASGRFTYNAEQLKAIGRQVPRFKARMYANSHWNLNEEPFVSDPKLRKPFRFQKREAVKFVPQWENNPTFNRNLEPKQVTEKVSGSLPEVNERSEPAKNIKVVSEVIKNLPSVESEPIKKFEILCPSLPAVVRDSKAIPNENLWQILTKDFADFVSVQNAASSDDLVPRKSPIVAEKQSKIEWEKSVNSVHQALSLAYGKSDQKETEHAGSSVVSGNKIVTSNPDTSKETRAAHKEPSANCALEIPKSACSKSGEQEAADLNSGFKTHRMYKKTDLFSIRDNVITDTAHVLPSEIITNLKRSKLWRKHKMAPKSSHSSDGSGHESRTSVSMDDRSCASSNSKKQSRISQETSLQAYQKALESYYDVLNSWYRHVAGGSSSHERNWRRHLKYGHMMVYGHGD